MVSRTYTTGISLIHLTKKEQKAAKRFLANYITDYGGKLAEICKKAIEPAIELAEAGTLRRGMIGAGQLRKEIGISANYADSAYMEVTAAAHGYVKQKKKLIDFIEKEKIPKFLQYLSNLN